MKRKPKTTTFYNVERLRTLLLQTPTMHHFDVIEQGSDSYYVFTTNEDIDGFNVFRKYNYDYVPTELEESNLESEQKTRLNEVNND